jgi:lipopolysaccharide export system protein LptA
MKRLNTIQCVIAAALIGAAASDAQDPEPIKEADLLKQIDSFGAASATPAPEGSPARATKPGKSGLPGAAAKQQGPTEITCTKEATFDNRSRRAVFTGSVKVKDPQFTISCERLTAVLRDSAAKKGADDRPGAQNPAGQQAGGLERAIAEGNVVIIQDKPGENGGPTKHYIGKGERAEYDAATGDVVLTGWPQVQQGINTQVATEAATVMTLNRDGRMKTQGGSKTVIQEQSGE